MEFKTSIETMFERQYLIFREDKYTRKHIQNYERKIIEDVLIRKINELEFLEQQIISLYYIDELTIEEISEVLNSEESKIIESLRLVIQKFENAIITQIYMRGINCVK